MVSRSDMAKPIALVTGASGFTGRYVCHALQQAGYEVHAWTHEAGESADFHQVDLTNRKQVHEALRRLSPEVVVHLAAISFVAHGDVDAIYRVNVVGTRNLLEGLAMLPKPPKRVLLASSANIYGNVEGVIDEDVCAAPQNDYAVSKLAMEHMARLWCRQLPITITRPFNYTGVGQSEKFLMPKIVSHFRRKADVIELGNLDIWRDFYDVRHVASIYARLLDVESNCDVYNICSGQEYSLRQAIEMMEQISGHTMEVRVNPDFVRPNEVSHLRGDPKKLAARIGGLPGFSLGDTLRWMYKE